MRTVLIPWKLPAYRSLNGFHPLISSVVEARPAGLDFVMGDPERPLDETQRRSAIMQISEQVNSFEQFAFTSDANESVLKTLRAYNFHMQFILSSYAGHADIVFHHTAPAHLVDLPYILHFESLTTLFYPALSTGETFEINIRQHPMYAIVKNRLESSFCRGVFTHIKSSAEAIIRCFDSVNVARKVSYIPLGVACPTAYLPRISEKLANINGPCGLNILFTSSHHRGLGSFFLRGGLEVLSAFKTLLLFFPTSKLTIVSAKPPGADPVIADMVANINWIEGEIDDGQLFDLFLWSDVSALPAVGLHSYTVLRSFVFGSVLICSDAPGYEEYIEDGETAIVVPGRFSPEVYRVDSQTGFTHDNYSAVPYPDRRIATGVAQAFLKLAQDPQTRQRLATNAHHHVIAKHPVEPWVQGVASLLNAA